MGWVIHFEIHAENPERALKFYSAVFGWTAQKWDGPESYWLMTTGPDGAGGLTADCWCVAAPPLLKVRQ